MNLNQTCNAFWNGSTVNFYRSGGGCRNTGEIAGRVRPRVGPRPRRQRRRRRALSNSSEGYADIAAIYRLRRPRASATASSRPRTTAAARPRTAPASTRTRTQNGGRALRHRLLGRARRRLPEAQPERRPTPPLGFVCSACLTGTGPCGRQVHCAAAPSAAGGLGPASPATCQRAPFSLDSQTAFIVGNRVFYQGSGNIGSWHSCTCASTVHRLRRPPTATCSGSPPTTTTAT